MKLIGMLTSAVSSYYATIASMIPDEYAVGSKRKKTKREKQEHKQTLSAELEERRAKLLAHQEESFRVRNLALERLSPQIRTNTPAARRNIKAGILGKKGGLKT